MPRRSVLACLGLVAACGGSGGGDPDAAPAPADATVDADPLTQIEPGDKTVLSPGNDDGQDEDPWLLRAADNSLYIVWFSNRNGLQVDGDVDNEIFLRRSTNGIDFTDPPIQIVRSDAWAFYPSLEQSPSGTFDLAWWRWLNKPDGCTPSLGDCDQGTDNRIAFKSSPDGLDWDLDSTVEITSGPGDWLPCVVHDRESDRVLVYFAATVRAANGTVDLAQGGSQRLYVVIRTDSGWSAPTRLIGPNPDGSNNTYPHVVQDADGTFLMTWTRYDDLPGNDDSGPLAVLSPQASASTVVMFATSTDGISFGSEVVMSEDDSVVDVFPWLYLDQNGQDWRVTWLSTLSGSAAQVEMPVGGTYPVDLVDRPEIEGYTGKITATATPGVYWGVFVDGADPKQKIAHRFFER